MESDIEESPPETEERVLSQIPSREVPISAAQSSVAGDRRVKSNAVADPTQSAVQRTEPRRRSAGAARPSSSEAEPDTAALTPGASVPPLPGYLSDSNAGTDQLDIAWEVEAFASLIAARGIEPPLSIGLFGAWGSGKSFFMRLMNERVAELVRTSNDASSPFCARVVQITFNAWHYIEADLWASLISRIFEGLFEALPALGIERIPAQRAILRRLASTEKLIRETEQKQAALLQQAQEAEQRAAEIAAEIARPELGKTLPSVSSAEDIKKLADALGIPADSSLAEIEKSATGIWRDVGKLTTAWRQLDRAAKERLRLRALITLSLAVAVAILSLWQWNRVPAILSIGLPALAAVLALAYQVVHAVVRFVNSIIDSEKQNVIKQLQANAKGFRDAAEAFRAQAAEQTKELEKIKARASEGAHDFIKEQYSSDKYRKQLGIVALVQRDLERLSELLHPATRSAAEHAANVPQIERIVLYIDDLDRCTPDRVIEVLQAIHLLLAFPLFVVVVGVDSRWLLSSLEQQYARQVSADAAAKRSEMLSTPQDYLEKIFQIPFWIRPMRVETLRRFLWASFSARPQSRDRTGPTTSGEAAGHQPARFAIQIDPFEIDSMARLMSFLPTPRAAKRLINTYRLLRTVVRSRDVSDHTSNTEGVLLYVILLLGLVTGFPAEASEIFAELAKSSETSFWSFVDGFTPRLNVTSEDYRNRIRDSMTRDEAERWQGLVDALRQFEHDPNLDSAAVFKAWAPVVERFSFRASKTSNNGRQQPPEPVAGQV